MFEVTIVYNQKARVERIRTNKTKCKEAADLDISIVGEDLKDLNGLGVRLDKGAAETLSKF
jgi:hypothetical protein